MCKAMEDMRNEAVRASNIKKAIMMLNDGMAYDKVAKYCELSLEEVEKLAEELAQKASA